MNRYIITQMKLGAITEHFALLAEFCFANKNMTFQELSVA